MSNDHENKVVNSQEGSVAQHLGGDDDEMAFVSHAAMERDRFKGPILSRHVTEGKKRALLQHRTHLKSMDNHRHMTVFSSQ